MTGLFFGSFNPIHNGHIGIARYILDRGYCEQVWFVVSPRNPLKADRTLLDEFKRLEIVQSAISDDDRMKACDVEFSMPKPSYTLETLQVLEKESPSEKFALIIGEDNLRDFHLWRNADVIAENYKILVYPRKGIETSQALGKNFCLIEAPLAEISSTGIRQMIREGKDISAWVPRKALAAILKYYNSESV